MNQRFEYDGAEGFTLIELLVVMIIVGVLAAVVLPTFLAVRARGSEASLKADLHHVAVEVENVLTDGPPQSALTISGNSGAWTISGGRDHNGDPVLLSGRLSPGNSVDSGSAVRLNGTYCISLANDNPHARHWRVQDNQVTPGSC